MSSTTAEIRDVRLPDGQPFAFWEDETRYHRIYHVAGQAPDASDANAGTEDKPFKTIGRAAEVLQPGEKAIIHAGIYRECVRPARGGGGPDAMIAYEAAPGEAVVVTGLIPWKPKEVPSRGWRLPEGPGAALIRMADLPADQFGSYNPFLARNVFSCLPYYGLRDDQGWMKRVLMRRGSVFQDGRPLQQVADVRELAARDGAFWVEEPGLRVHYRLFGDAAGEGASLEITAREQLFAPAVDNLGYIRVSGLRFLGAANGIPVPQRGAVSTMRGHHWIIEDCGIERVNGCGMDIGCQSWDCDVPEAIGHHIVRRNAIRHCGICGIAGARGVVSTLIEDNVIEHIGYHDLERLWECAGIKFHFAYHTLFRRNTIRHVKNAGGIWLDVGNVNNRITNNVFADIESITGAVYSEMNYELNLLDNNLFWDIRRPAYVLPVEEGLVAAALHCDCNEKMICAHNFFGKIEGYAVLFSLHQAERRDSGRTGVCRSNMAANNIFYQCPHRIHLGRREENVADGNLYDAADDNCSFTIQHPHPPCFQNLVGWREYFQLDTNSTQARLRAEFDVESGVLRLAVEGAGPTCRPLPLPGEPTEGAAIPGPLEPDVWRLCASGALAEQRFPRR